MTNMPKFTPYSVYSFDLPITKEGEIEFTPPAEWEHIIKEMIREQLEKPYLPIADQNMFDSSVWSLATHTTAQAAPTLNAEEMFRKIRSMHLQFQRTAVVFQVDLAHVGPILQVNHETNGTIFECSPAQAQKIHQEIPLILQEVLSEHVALFRPAHQYDGCILRTLSRPPYDMPPEVSDD